MEQLEDESESSQKEAGAENSSTKQTSSGGLYTGMSYNGNVL